MAAAKERPLRLFLALWPDERTQRKLAQWRDSWQWPASASPSRVERLHVTLHFIGAVAPGRLPELMSGLQAPFRPFTLDFGRAELWPGIAAVCPDSTPDALAQLHTDLGSRLQLLSLPVEDRPFRPHVTVARRAQGAEPPTTGPRLKWQVRDGYALMESLPGGQGYRLLHRFAGTD